MRTILRFRPSPSMAVALAALLVAAGGVAFATIPDSGGTIHGCYDKNGDLRVVESASGCRRNETAIEWNQEGPPGPSGEGATLVRDVEASEVSTNSDGVAVDLGGPSVTVDVPDGALVGIFLSMEAKHCGSSAIARVFEPTDFPETDRDSQGPRVVGGGADWRREYTTPLSGSFFSRKAIAGFGVVYPATPGTRTYTVRYLHEGSGPSCVVSFRNRQLWVQVNPLTR